LPNNYEKQQELKRKLQILKRNFQNYLDHLIKLDRLKAGKEDTLQNECCCPEENNDGGKKKMGESEAA